MAVIKGQNLRIKFGGKYVAYATSCSVHVSANLEESSTKDSTGDWQEQEVTGLSWDVSAEALYSVETDATGVNGSDALDLVIAKQPVQVEFEKTTGAKNREGVDETVLYKGNAIVNDVSITAANRQNTTYSLQAQGTGPLEKDYL